MNRRSSDGLSLLVALLLPTRTMPRTLTVLLLPLLWSAAPPVWGFGGTPHRRYYYYYYKKSNLRIEKQQRQQQHRACCSGDFHQPQQRFLAANSDREFPDSTDNKKSQQQQQDETTTTHTQRRPFLLQILAGIAASSFVVPPIQNSLAAVSSDDSTTNVVMTTKTTTTVAEVAPKVTDRVFLNVRISRRDGTFYVRDDLPETPENQVFYGRLVLELFGEVVPQTCEKFKSYVVVATNSLNDNNNNIDDPLPSYARSTFPAFDAATGVLYGGKIPGLELTEVGGSSALRYGGRLLPASLWVEQRRGSQQQSSSAIRLSHVGKGLLTHKVLEPLPVFGITTRTDTRQLDGTHVVFGRLKLEPNDDDDGEVNENDAKEFLNIVTNLPTYTVDSRPMPLRQTAQDDAAQSIFQAQRSFFRQTAKALGDTRLDKVYEGKLLRRVEVTQAGFL